MAKRKKIKERQTDGTLVNKIQKVVADLYYISETDAEIFPFAGEKAKAVTNEVVLAQTGNPKDSAVEERNFEEFFAPLLEIQDWFGDEEKETARKFSILKELLKENLKDLKVFKVGKIELDVYVVGLDSDNFLTGIKTKAVET